MNGSLWHEHSHAQDPWVSQSMGEAQRDRKAFLVRVRIRTVMQKLPITASFSGMLQSETSFLQRHPTQIG